MTAQDLRNLLQRSAVRVLAVGVTVVCREGIDRLDHLQERAGQVVEVGVEASGESVAKKNVKLDHERYET